MTATTAVAGELPKGDPALLNRVAWNCRWSSREKSRTFAKAALNMIGHPPPKRPESAYGYALTTLAWQAKWRGDFGVAMTQGLDAETHLSEAAHPCARAHIYSILGVLHYSKNRLDLAANSVERGLSLASPDDHTDAYIDLLTTKATVKRLNGDRSRSSLILGRARDLATGAELARVEHNIARSLMSDEMAVKGLQHAQAALDLCMRHDNRVVLPYAHEVVGACHVVLQDFAQAEVSFAAGLDVAIEDHDFRAQCQIIHRDAALENARNNLERARDLYRCGAQIAKEMNYDLWSRDFALALANVYEELGDLKKSIDSHKRAWRFEKARRT